ncbi:hypothetical protein BOTBODRAFT_175465 [Botryobasidium botryosum FD-172 SS1]|uniref:Uncharacterized protein n=1 Tax=Botryobasidium botryosum (strain FD-172 SS1) TaxID=930990 RepID=A0A067MPD9_BOTB1|nr:hypothetical protein BOTBODRAFT_175465 [Botryobasidium botryosum FD-172 SS1]
MAFTRRNVHLRAVKGQLQRDGYDISIDDPTPQVRHTRNRPVPPVTSTTPIARRARSTVRSAPNAAKNTIQPRGASLPPSPPRKRWTLQPDILDIHGYEGLATGTAPDGPDFGSPGVRGRRTKYRDDENNQYEREIHEWQEFNLKRRRKAYSEKRIQIHELLIDMERRLGVTFALSLFLHGAKSEDRVAKHFTSRSIKMNWRFRAFTAEQFEGFDKSITYPQQEHFAERLEEARERLKEDGHESDLEDIDGDSTHSSSEYTIGVDGTVQGSQELAEFIAMQDSATLIPDERESSTHPQSPDTLSVITSTLPAPILRYLANRSVNPTRTLRVAEIFTNRPPSRREQGLCGLGFTVDEALALIVMWSKHNQALSLQSQNSELPVPELERLVLQEGTGWGQNNVFQSGSRGDE